MTLENQMRGNASAPGRAPDVVKPCFFKEEKAHEVRIF